MIRHQLAFIAAATLLPGASAFIGACSDSTAPSPGDFTVSPSSAWAGAQVRVRSAAFIGAAATTVFTLAGLSLPAHQADDSTWVVTLPALASGNSAITVSLAGKMVTLDPVHIRGFTDAHTFDADILWDVSPFPGSGDAQVVGADANGALVLINASTHTADTWADFVAPASGLHGPGLTTSDNELLLWPAGASEAQRWRLGASPEHVADLGIAAPVRQVVQLGPDLFVLGHAHAIAVSASGVETTYSAEEPEGFVMSPAHDRLAVRVNSVPDKVPVFDVATGAVAYRIAPLQAVQAAAFSPDGSMLAVAGGAVAGESGTVLLLRASDGAVMHDTTVTSAVWSIAFDRERPLIYVGVDVPDPSGQGTARPGILVFDQGSFALVGEMQVASSAPACIISGCFGGVLVTSTEPAVYAVWSWQGDQTFSWRFGTGD